MFWIANNKIRYDDHTALDLIYQYYYYLGIKQKYEVTLVTFLKKCCRTLRLVVNKSFVEQY